MAGVLFVCWTAVLVAFHQPPKVGGPGAVLEPSTRLTIVNSRPVWTKHRGRRALHLAPLAGDEHGVNQEMVAILDDTDFQDGVIEADIAGARRAGYSTAEDTSGFKGFVGISFRVSGNNAERFYVRPENSRLDNQLFRNRSTQYESDPDYSWRRLRAESPGMYESYVDLVPGEWTRLKIIVAGRSAALYVNGAAQPCLVVTDLKHGVSRGKIALWTHVSTEAYFANVRVTRATTSTANAHAD